MAPNDLAPAPPAPAPAAHRPVVAVAAGATFLAFLDVTVVNLAMPDLARHFRGASLSDLSWVITAYAVAFAALLAPAGRVADVVGRRRVFLGAVAGFTVTSGLLVLSPGVVELALLRGLQGAAAAAMLPAALGLVLVAAPPERRAAAVGAWGAAGGLAAALGPTLGGLAVAWLDWRAVFLLNVPLGIALVLVAARVLPHESPVRARAPLPHVPGTLALVAGLALAVLALGKAADWDGLRVATVGAAGLLLVAVALRVSWRHPAPPVEVQLWRSPVFATANAASGLLGGALFAWLLLGVLFLTTAWEYGVLRAGLAMTPGALAAAAGAVLAGHATALAAQRVAVAGGALVWAVVAGGLALVLEPEPAFVSLWLPASVVTGVAIGAALTALTSAAADALSPAQLASGVGLNLTARQVGGALGVAGLALLVEAHRGFDGLVHGYLLVAGLAALAGVVALALRPAAGAR